MKKLFCLLGFCALVLTSCSTSDSASTTDENEVLVMRTIETYANDGSTFTTNFIYNGKKLVRATDLEGYEKFTYTGDLVTLIEYFDAANTLLQTETYTYNSAGLLTSSLSLDFDFNNGIRETYVYNTDATVSVTGFQGDLTSQTNLVRTGVITFANGDVSTYENTIESFGETSTTTYVYDVKNNPFKNIIGFDKLKFVNSESIRGTRNVLTQSYSSPSLTYVFSSSYTYNGLNFPTLETTIEDGSPSETETTQYFYN